MIVDAALGGPGTRMPLVWLLVSDAAAWCLLSLGVGYVGHRWPAARLARSGWITAPRRFERGGHWYERRLSIRRWKDAVPEAGAFFAGGRSKRRLGGRDRGSLEDLTIETRRAEGVHWALMAVTPLFALWNPRPLFAAMVGYALVANLPCIAIQRYNRARLVRVLTLGDRRAELRA